MRPIPSYLWLVLTLPGAILADNNAPEAAQMPFKLGDPNCNRSMGMGMGGGVSADNSQWSGMPGPGAPSTNLPPQGMNMSGDYGPMMGQGNNPPENAPNMGAPGMMGGYGPMMGQGNNPPENAPNMGAPGMMGGYGPMMGRTQPDNSGGGSGMNIGGAPRYGQWGGPPGQAGMMMPPFPPMHPPSGGAAVEQRLDGIERRLEELMRHLQASQPSPR